MQKKKEFNPEEEVVGDYKPLISLPGLKTMTGEEQEKVKQEIRLKFYKFDDNQWNNRGTGDLKILQNSETGIKCFLLRQH